MRKMWPKIKAAKKKELCVACKVNCSGQELILSLLLSESWHLCGGCSKRETRGCFHQSWKIPTFASPAVQTLRSEGTCARQLKLLSLYWFNLSFLRAQYTDPMNNWVIYYLSWLQLNRGWTYVGVVQSCFIPTIWEKFKLSTVGDAACLFNSCWEVPYRHLHTFEVRFVCLSHCIAVYFPVLQGSKIHRWLLAEIQGSNIMEMKVLLALNGFSFVDWSQKHPFPQLLALHNLSLKLIQGTSCRNRTCPSAWCWTCLLNFF